MFCFTHPPDPWVLDEPRGLNPALLATPQAQPGREQLRHLIIGSPDGVRSAVHTLHLLNYADQSLWSSAIAIPASGIVITPEQGEVFRYLLRYRQLS